MAEAVRLEVVPDDCDEAGVVGGEFAEAADGEGYVFDGVTGVVLGCGQGGELGGEKTTGVCEVLPSSVSIRGKKRRKK